MYNNIKQYKKIILFLSACCILLYANSLRNKYALDDEYITVTNFKVPGQNYIPNNSNVAKGFGGILKIWKSRYAHDSEGSFDYRPVTSTSFAIEYQFFGQSPLMSHVINLVLYILTVLSIFSILITLLKDNPNNLTIAFFTSFLFLLLPLHTEVVDNIKCRDELFAFLFSLIALWYAIKYMDTQKMKYLFFVFLFLLLGFFSKKTAVLFVAVIPLSLFFFRKLKIKTGAIFVLVFVILNVVFRLIKSKTITESTVRNFYHFENPLFTIKASFFIKIIIAFKTFGFYILSLVFPYPLRCYYGVSVFDVSADVNIYLFIGIAFLITSIYYSYKTKNKLFIFSLLLFCGCIFPFLNFMTPVAGIVGERLAYMASFGFCLMLIALLESYLPSVNEFKLSVFTSKPLVYSLPIIAISFFYVLSRNTNWKDKVILFEHDAQYSKNSAKLNNMLANEYFEMLRSPNKKYSDQVLIQKSLTHYNLAMTADSSLYTAFNNAGVVSFSYLNDVELAKKYFILAINHKEKYAQAYENLGNCYMRSNDTKTSIPLYLKAISFNQKQYTSYISLIKLLFQNREYDKCLKVCNISSQVFPFDYEITAQTANSYLLKGDTLGAMPHFEEAYRINPNKQLATYIAKKYAELKNSTKYQEYNNK